tara:strand:+ start:1821 stop:2105 length:285 start_codon:yes stop_codon:yes gene_type:complete
LETFLKGITSYDKAVEFFSEQGVFLPEGDQLKKFFEEKDKSPKKPKKKVELVSKPAVVQKPETSTPKSNASPKTRKPRGNKRNRALKRENKKLS